MPVFGGTVLSVDEAPPREIELRNEKGEGSGVFVVLRQLPKAMAERLSRPLQVRARRLNEKSSDAELNRLDEDTQKFKRQSCSLTLEDTREMKWRFFGPTAVARYEPHLGPIQDGEPVLLDGKWSEGFKAAFFVDEPWLLDVIVDAYTRMTAISEQEKREEEAGKEKTSSVG